MVDIYAIDFLECFCICGDLLELINFLWSSIEPICILVLVLRCRRSIKNPSSEEEKQFNMYNEHHDEALAKNIFASWKYRWLGLSG